MEVNPRVEVKPAKEAAASKVKHGFKDDELDGLNVLVVEDNHFQLRIVKATLQRSGVTLDVALHGEEAVAHVRKRVDAELETVRSDPDGLHDAGDGRVDGDAGDSCDRERVPVVQVGRRSPRRG